MLQHLEAADFGALGLNGPTVGTAIVKNVLPLVDGKHHRLRVLLENSTGSRWVCVFPYRQDHRDLEAGHRIHARFSVYRRGIGEETWATEVTVLATSDIEEHTASSTMERLSRACRTNSRITIHALAVMAISGETLASQTVIDYRIAREAVLTGIRKLPPAEAILLMRFAETFDL